MFHKLNTAVRSVRQTKDITRKTKIWRTNDLDTNQKKGNVTSKMEMTSFLFSLVILFGLFGLQFLYMNLKVIGLCQINSGCRFFFVDITQYAEL
jgi:hypothetical protein